MLPSTNVLQELFERIWQRIRTDEFQADELARLTDVLLKIYIVLHTAEN